MIVDAKNNNSSLGVSKRQSLSSNIIFHEYHTLTPSVVTSNK